MRSLTMMVFVSCLLTAVACSGSAGTPTATSSTTTPVTTTTATPSITTSTITTSTTTTSATPPVSTSVEPGQYEVFIYWGMNYQPNDITIPAGSTVTLIMVNGQDPSHPVIFNFGPYESTVVGTDVHITITFTRPGVYSYYCAEHGNPGYIRVI